jgi:hypothetical protein
MSVSVGRFRLGLLIVVLLLMAGASQGEDISLSEVPAAVRVVIERELKDAEIDDLERDKDDGEIVYKIDAKSDNDNDIKLKIAEDGTVLELEKEMDADDLPAVILEAVKKFVGEIYIDDVEKRARKGSKAFYRIRGDNDDLEIELQVGEDGTILDKEVKRYDDDDDDDLPRDFDDVRRMFRKLRGQLRVVFIGDSRVEMGIDPKYFYGEENRKYPTALNMSANYSHGSGVLLAQLLVEDYYPHAPKLEWVVYGVSTRVFNRHFNPDAARDIRRTRIYRSDKRGRGWDDMPSELVPAGDVDGDDLSPWGFEGEDGTDDDLEDKDDRDDILDDLRKGRYKFDYKRFDIFESVVKTLAERNVNLLAFTPPMHPITAGQPCTDDDGSTAEAYDEIVKRMRAFDEKYPNLYFIDVNKKGRHNFEHKEFNDLDHLNRRGAKKLTLMLNEFIKAVDSGDKAGVVTSAAK